LTEAVSPYLEGDHLKLTLTELARCESVHFGPLRLSKRFVSGGAQRPRSTRTEVALVVRIIYMILAILPIIQYAVSPDLAIYHQDTCFNPCNYSQSWCSCDIPTCVSDAAGVLILLDSVEFPSGPHPQSYTSSSSKQSKSALPRRALIRLWTWHNHIEADFRDDVCLSALL